jgi:hypothetical protein
VGLVIGLALVGIAIFLGAKFIPVKVAAYEFRDTIREECRLGAVRSTDAAVRKRIMEKAAELEIPLKGKNLTIQRTPSRMIITARYEQPIDLKVTTYVYRFDHKEKAPLF